MQVDNSSRSTSCNGRVCINGDRKHIGPFQTPIATAQACDLYLYMNILQLIETGAVEHGHAAADEQEFPFNREFARLKAYHLALHRNSL